MRKIPLKYEIRLNHLTLLYKKVLLDLPRVSKRKNHHYKLWYKRQEKIFNKRNDLLFRYEHKCKCGAIIKLRFDECIHCQSQTNY